MDIVYLDILSNSVEVANIDIIYWSVHPYFKRGEDGAKQLDGRYRFNSPHQVSLIENIKI